MWHMDPATIFCAKCASFAITVELKYHSFFPFWQYKSVTFL